MLVYFVIELSISGNVTNYLIAADGFLNCISRVVPHVTGTKITVILGGYHYQFYRINEKHANSTGAFCFHGTAATQLNGLVLA